MKRRVLLWTGVGAAAAGFAAGPLLWELVAGDTSWIEQAQFTDLDGRPRRLAEWQGRSLAVNFWASWCAPCREEIPLLMAARERHAPRGLEVVGIAIDVPAKAREYAAAMAIRYPLLVGDGAGLELMRRLGNRSGSLPFTVFAKSSGRVVQRKLGALSAAELEEALARILA